MRRIWNVRRIFIPLLTAISCGAVAPSYATPALTMDLATGAVLYQQDATRSWFPASTTKLMTVYVALSAVRDGKITMDTPLAVSDRAHSMPPSKMGFPVGTQVTLNNALKMLMVRSANDIAIVVAEGISGSVEAFADDMNHAGTELGLRESHFANPNGLPDPDHYSSARDMALIARALYTQFPEAAPLFDIGALSMGSEVIVNHNNLLGRYPGADGMKTGFTCSAGFNIVATANRDGRRVVAVVFGAPTVAVRTAKIAALFDRAFAGVDQPNLAVASLPSVGGTPVDLRDHVCRNRKALIAQFDDEVTQLDAPLTTPQGGSAGLSALNPARAFLFSAPASTEAVPTALMINSMPRPSFNPIPVHIGAEPGYNGVVAQARAPHTPIGSEPQPVAVEAYADSVAVTHEGTIGESPLKVDKKALPLRGRSRNARGHHPSTLKASAEAPKTKVIAEDKGSKPSKAHPKAVKAASKKPAVPAKKIKAAGK